jgi:hypothetical protein
MLHFAPTPRPSPSLRATSYPSCVAYWKKTEREFLCSSVKLPHLVPPAERMEIPQSTPNFSSSIVEMGSYSVMCVEDQIMLEAPPPPSPPPPPIELTLSTVEGGKKVRK